MEHAGTASPESLTALDARREIDAGRLTATRLVEACLERIENRDGVVQAWVSVDEKGARALARRLDEAPSNRLLHGIPFGAKDIIDSVNLPSTYGSPIYSDHRPPWDGSTTALSRAAGGILLGKTVTTEFANRHAGPTTNPSNPGFSPGGSSSGSGAAVADFHVPIASGTQTGGSVIRPASYCGAYGYKPTFQHFGNAGVRTNTEAFDTVGLIARSIADLALFRAAAGELPFAEPDPDIRAPRIALCRTPLWDKAQQETQDAVEKAFDLLGAAGAATFELVLDPLFDGIEPAHRVICGFESVRNYADELRRYPEKVSDDFMRERVSVGRAATIAQFRDALRLGVAGRRRLAALMADQKIDAILCPSAPGEAPAGLASTGSAIFNALWTHMHLPCVTLPRFTGPNGLPVGVQLVGDKHDDERLLSIALWADHVMKASLS